MANRVGTLTFHNAYNNGAVLQAYALQRAIFELGYETEIINYASPSIVSSSERKASFRGKIAWVLDSRMRSRRISRFEEFKNKNMVISKEVSKSELPDLNGYYDLFVVGSDQVWNPNLTDGDTAYFLDFVEKDESKLSYAASLGLSEWPQEYYKRLPQLLKTFHGILVREKTAQAYLDDEFGIKSDVVCDPVFLLSADEWHEIAAPRLVKNDYVLVFSFGRPRSDCVEWAKKVAARENLELVVMHQGARTVSGVRNIRDAGPKEFLSLIYHSSGVITHSFHASCFSILFGKRYCWFQSKSESSNIQSRASRLQDILSTFEMESCISSGEDTPQFSSIPAGVEDKIREVRDESIGRLKASFL